jgi:hypothetical protein
MPSELQNRQYDWLLRALRTCFLLVITWLVSAYTSYVTHESALLSQQFMVGVSDWADAITTDTQLA